MEKVFLLLLSLIPFLLPAQIVFLQPTETGHEKIIAQKLMENRYVMVSTEDSADIIIKTDITSHVVMGTGRAQISIFKAGSDEMLVQSKSVRSTFNAFEGYKTPASLSVRKITDKQLIPMIKKIDPKYFTKSTVRATSSTASISVADELKKLKDLLDSKAITQEEYDTMKKKLIN